MGLQLLIAFDVDPSDLSAVHRVGNCAEDLHASLEATGQARLSLDQIDRATNAVQVKVLASRHIGAVEQMIKKVVRRHNLSARISRAS